MDKKEFDQNICLYMDPRNILMRNYLQLLSCWLAFLMYGRFFTTFFNDANTILSMFIAIMATILPMLEKLSQSRVKSPEGYIWTRYIMSSIKGMLMMTVFVVNGVANDFFIGCSFYATTLIGYIYFKINPYQDPEIDKNIERKSNLDKYDKKLLDIHFRAVHDIYSKAMGNGYKTVSLLSCLMFIIMVLVAMHSPYFPVTVLQVYVNGEFTVSSIAMAAVIMILYNLFTWVEFTQILTKGKQFPECKDEMERAQLLIADVDMICEACSTIKNSIAQKDLQEPEFDDYVHNAAKIDHF